MNVLVLHALDGSNECIVQLNALETGHAEGDEGREEEGCERG